MDFPNLMNLGISISPVLKGNASRAIATLSLSGHIQVFVLNHLLNLIRLLPKELLRLGNKRICHGRLGLVKDGGSWLKHELFLGGLTWPREGGES